MKTDCADQRAAAERLTERQITRIEARALAAVADAAIAQRLITEDMPDLLLALRYERARADAERALRKGHAAYNQACIDMNRGDRERAVQEIGKAALILRSLGVES